MNNFEIINKTKEDIKELEELKKFINYALEFQNIKNSIFNIIIVDELTIKNINKEYRGKDSVTDVISFALEDDTSFIQMQIRVLGDVYICLNRVKSQSIEYCHSFFRELSFLTIHGLLHLLGYDHMDVKEEKIMFDLQKKILDEYGIKR